MNSNGQAPVRYLPAVMASVVAVLILLTSLSFWFSPNLLEEGDLAANALQVERAREGYELLGPYSRYEFHHPGPISFYGQVLAEPAFVWLPTLMARHLAGQLAVNLLLVVWILRLLVRAGLEADLAALGVLFLVAPLVFLSGGNAMMLTSIWGPRLVVMPTVLFVVAVARFCDGDDEAFTAAAVGGTVAYHAHLMTIPVIAVGVLAGVVTFLCRRSGNSGGCEIRRRHLIAGTAIWVGGAVPVLVEQLTSRPGNLTLLWRFVRDNTPTTHPWSEVLHDLGQAWTDPIVVLWGRAGFDGNNPAVSLTVLSFLLVVSGLQYRRSATAWRLVLGAVWGALALAFVLARHTYGDLETYLFYYIYGLVGVLYLAVGREIWVRCPTSWRDRLPRRDLVLAAVGVVGLGAWLVVHPIEPPPAGDRFAEIAAIPELSGGASVRLELGPGPTDRTLWPHIPTHALHWRRAGFRVTVDSQLVFMCGEEMRPRPGSLPTIRLVLTRLLPMDEELTFLPRRGWGIVVLPAGSGPTAELLARMRERDQP